MPLDAPFPPPDLPLPGDFAGPDLATTPERYRVELDPAVTRELQSVATALARGEAPAALEPAVHAAVGAVSARVREHLTHGSGVSLVRGVPTAGFDRDTLARLFTLLGTALGEPVPQNLEGERVTDIRDSGADPRDAEVRLYRTRAEQDFHTDGADVIGLLCLSPAASGGTSRIVSSARVVRQVLARHPDLAPRLFAPWFFHVPGAKERGLPPVLPRPISTFDGRAVETFFIGWYLRNAQGLGSAPALSPDEEALLQRFEAIANDPALHLDMDFRPGDVQWLRNAYVLHKRTAYEDPPPPAPKRHLLRLWLAAPYLADGTPRFAPDGRVS